MTGGDLRTRATMTMESIQSESDEIDRSCHHLLAAVRRAGDNAGARASTGGISVLVNTLGHPLVIADESNRQIQAGS